MGQRKLLTLAFPRDNLGRILLGWKKRGFGRNKWNGFGGKVESSDSSVAAAALRELQEECGLNVIDTDAVRTAGVLLFEFLGDPILLEVHVFEVTRWSGEPIESEEMRPQWFTPDEVPYDHMWPDDRHWLPLLFQQKRFDAFFQFQGDDMIHKITDYKINIIE